MAQSSLLWAMLAAGSEHLAFLRGANGAIDRMFSRVMRLQSVAHIEKIVATNAKWSIIGYMPESTEYVLATAGMLIYRDVRCSANPLQL